MLSNTKNLKVFAWQRDTLIDIAQKTVESFEKSKYLSKIRDYAW